MRKQLATMVLAAAIGPVLGGFLPRAMAQVAPPAAAAPAPAAAAVPVKRVVLYTSGVGYFEHFGTIHGDASTVLSFKTDQINDVLKSLLLEDIDGGRVTSISYPTLAPLAQTLKSFQVDLSSDPPLAEILKQLRGAQVTATLPTGPVSGEVLGVEQKERPVGTGADAKVVEVWIVNLLNDSGISPVDLANVTQLKLDDPALAAEMTKALAAVALARDKDKKPVTISFTGQGDHRVRIGYVVETPIWKASYRLSLGEAGAANAPANPKIPADQQGKIQGWAIVDNQTDNDWAGVELSLVSGRPISFIEDLYQPLYVPRPTVVPDLFAGLLPPPYDEGVNIGPGVSSNGGIGGTQDLALKANDQTNAAFAPIGGRDRDQMYRSIQRQQLIQARSGYRFNDSLGSDFATSASVQPMASGAKVGEAFEYTVHDVALARQKSSMIPILAGPMQAERLSIYNASVLPNNPLLGARLTNTSGGYIMQGPITILDHGIYAGDAQVLDMPPDANRLISYGVDQRMQVNGGEAKNTSQLLTAKIVKGVLQVSTEAVTDQTYTATNKADADKLLLIEHPRQTDWQLIQPKKARETTDSLYRFELPVPAGKSASLEVQTQHVYWQSMEIMPSDMTALVSYSQDAAIPQPVKDALVKAIQLKQAVTDTDRELAQLQQDKVELSAEQDRMRKNMEAVSPGTDYYKKLLQKMDGQETQFEQMETHEKQLAQEKQDRQKQLDDYLSSLTVE
jgi:hypothetical protein